MTVDSPFIPPVRGKGLTLRTCEVCGEPFRCRGTVVTNNKNHNGGRYCSPKCRGVAMRKGPARGSMWVKPEPYEPSKEEA
jgi:hypothetical protein